MTVKQFADKYDVPYNVAYKASLVIRPPATYRTDNDYDEKQLREESLKFLVSRIRNLKSQYEQYATAYRKLKQS